MFCRCGCGQRTPLASRTYKRSGQVRGKPLKFVPGHLAIRNIVEMKRCSRLEDRWHMERERLKLVLAV